MSFADRLAAAVQKTGSVACVGLDPRKKQLPAPLRDSVSSDKPDAWAAAYTQFCCEIIDAVAGKVPCVKPQAAFFEQLGPAGMISLGEVIRHANRAGLLVITDGKRNDIGSTATAYAHAYLGSGDSSPWGSDSLTVSPYLGRDSLEPFVDVCDQNDAGIFALVKTSNPGGGLLQDRQTDGQTVFERVAELVTELNSTRIGQSGIRARRGGGGSHVSRTIGRASPSDTDGLESLSPDSGLRAEVPMMSKVHSTLPGWVRWSIVPGTSSLRTLATNIRTSMATRDGRMPWRRPPTK